MFDLSSISRDAPVLIAGPTASGKSALALALAQRDGRIVVNADALQVYGNWRILTARPSIEEEALAPHRLYGHVARDQSYSVGHWLRDLTPLLGQKLVIVGGTGLYFKGLTQGLAEIPAIPAEVRALADQRRATDWHSMIEELDPATRAKIDTLNPARVQRAWEVMRATGQGLAHWQAQTGPALLPQSQAQCVVLRPDVAWLDRRIEQRFDQMMALGALEEAQLELPHWQPHLPASRAIGAPELIAHLQGDMTLKAAIAAAKLASRQYAKRQRTWFRSQMADWQPIHLG